MSVDMVLSTVLPAHLCQVSLLRSGPLKNASFELTYFHKIQFHQSTRLFSSTMSDGLEVAFI